MPNSLRTRHRTPAEELPRVRCPRHDGTLAILDSRGWHRQRLATPLNRIDLVVFADGRPVLCSAWLTSTRAGYGSRPWFHCPNCNARRLDLFIAAGRFACRGCLGLTYWSRSRHSRHVDAARRDPAGALSPRRLALLLEATIAEDKVLRRLQRERPDLFPLVLTGEMSKAEGMERAGYRWYGRRGWRRVSRPPTVPTAS